MTACLSIFKMQIFEQLNVSITKKPPRNNWNKSPHNILSPQISSWMCIFLLHSSSCHKLQIRASYNVWHSRAACGFHQVRTRCSLHVWIHRTMENQFMHPFKPNNSYITVLVPGQAAASIAVISPKWSCIWFYHLWGDIDSCTYVCQTLQCMLSLNQTFEHSQFVQSWIGSTLHLRNPFLFFSICGFIKRDCCSL